MQVSTRFWVFEDEATGEMHVTMAPLIVSRLPAPAKCLI